MTNLNVVPLLDLRSQFATIELEVREAMERVIRSQHFILGPEVESLEKEIASYSGCQFGVGVSSGTDALLVALMAIGVGEGDEVITTPYTFFATVGCIRRLGAIPVFVDIEPRTFNIDAAKIDRVVSERTRAIVPVHLYGQMAEMEPIMEIARRHKIRVIEDAAQAIGAEFRGLRAGSIGDLGCFSFFPSKNLGAFGDGGMVTTNDPELAERVRLLRSHGSKPKYYHRIIGGNFRLDAIQAAVLRAKLKHLDRWTTARQQNAEAYRRLFHQAQLTNDTCSSDEEGPCEVALPYEAPAMRHIYNQFVIRVDKKKRDELIMHLANDGIGSEVYYPLSLHMQECFSDLGYKAGDFPESESAARESLALPIYPELALSMQAQVVNSVARYFQR
jgi:dTDP-4-amino-4,6-dideoxygalactose transaminase